MALLFLLLLACVLIGLFVESPRTRFVGFAVAGVMAVGIIAYALFREHQELPAAPGGSEPAAAPQQVQRSLMAMKPSDIAVVNRVLEPVVETVTGNDGQPQERPNLHLWTFAAEVRNLTADHAVKDVTLRVRLYSCPSYFTTPNNALQVDELRLRCTTNGERSVGIYDVDVPAGGSKPFSQQITFIDQREPVNWRYTVDVERVVAAVN